MFTMGKSLHAPEEGAGFPGTGVTGGYNPGFLIKAARVLKPLSHFS